MAVVNKPMPRISKALVIAGSDARGLAYGVFSLSEKMGVSPWWWWADVPVRHQDSLILHKPAFRSEPPSVRYRGIFINDEDWGLRPWAANTFEPTKKNIGPKTYALVCELLLRLKANLLWPAMHPGTEPFFADPANLATASAYGIVIGSSHAEPMLRNNVGEWDEKIMGPFNYQTNRQAVYTYWEERVRQSVGADVVYTLGMRGVHDSGLEGVKSAKEAVPLVQRIIQDQRALLRRYLKKDVASFPQVLTAYKEVLDIYDHGLRLPADVTTVWPDDNYGYIQRLNTVDEARRPGGSGVYYHASYWGRPHDYLWLGTTHPSLLREEMTKAYTNGARRLWVLNVGDIKPLEYQLQLFLDMAYHTQPFLDSRSTSNHLQQWCAGIFGQEKGRPVADALWRSYDLAFERRPEFMGWSQTEPTTETTNTAYNHFLFGDEGQRRIDAYDRLQQGMIRLRREMDPAAAAAFYELAYYPVVCAGWMNKKFLYRDKAFWYGRQHRVSARSFAVQSKAAYDSILSETAYFNNRLLEGKWKGMLSAKPRDLPVFGEPVLPETTPEKGKGWSLLPEGTEKRTAGSRLMLPSFLAESDQRYFVDLFLTDTLTLEWQARPGENWLVLSENSGQLSPGKSQQRIWVTIDARKLPDRDTVTSTILFGGNGVTDTVSVKVFQPFRKMDSVDKGFVEINGIVSMFASHYTRKVDDSTLHWVAVEGLGHIGTAMQVEAKEGTTTELAVVPSGATLTYDFYSFSATPVQVQVYTLPTHPLNRNTGMRYGVQLDNGPVQLVDFKTIGRSEEWKQNVLRNAAIKTVGFPALSRGRHSLTMVALDPGVVLDRVVLQFGKAVKNYGVIPETVLSK